MVSGAESCRPKGGKSETGIRHNSLCQPSSKWVPYFFSYKTEFFSFQNDPKDVDPSYKTDLDLLDCLGRVKLVL